MVADQAFCWILVIYFMWVALMVGHAAPMVPDRKFPPALSAFDGRPTAELRAAIATWEGKLKRLRTRPGMEPFDAVERQTWRYCIDKLREGLAAREGGRVE